MTPVFRFGCQWCHISLIFSCSWSFALLSSRLSSSHLLQYLERKYLLLALLEVLGLPQTLCGCPCSVLLAASCDRIPKLVCLL